jgi:diaminohydroxyphosphoribosylaminopyrimidine deaminase/5-amino-6-(5-phosphoribosylamino)uracil reductase
MKEKRPFVIVKAAMTLDGRIATPRGDSKWISSEESRKYVHELRNHVDAVLVGVGTVAKDDPLLTCRIEGGRDPLRIIIDPRFEIPASAKCMGHHTMIFTFRDPSSRPDVMKSGTRIVQLSVGPDGRFSWENIWKFLGKMGLHSVLVEGGSTILSSLIRSKLVDEILIFVAPKLLGGGIPVVSWEPPDTIAGSLPLVISGVKTIGSDVLISAHLEE